ncbi:ATP-dependent DNA helicase [Bacillus smithii]|uniref:ATP-dependent DNA helicase n=1 Tax=Bacillus smithii TaxID=1479 RepID=UPI002E2191F7|nr:ATP-dependent DNA helicase [Bacillus smithii]
MESKAEKIFNIFENEIPKYYKTAIIRMSQVQMAMDIAAFLDNNESKRIMFIEAPVGIGKSLGSLIPSMIESNKGKNSRVVYATATINLQGQLMNSEVPLLKKLSLVKQPILAKGKTHYYCHKEFTSRKNQFSSKEREIFSNFFSNAETGQRNEFEDNFMQDISESKWAKVALNTSKKECERCHFSMTCPTNNHRNNFMSLWNDLIITNHDQLVRSVLNLTAEPRQSPIIPVDPGIIIIDEAHHFLENFLNQLEQSFTLFKLRGLKKSISNKHKKRYEQLLDSVEKIINEQLSSNEVSLQGRYRITEDLSVILEELNSLVNDSLVEESTRQMNKYSARYTDDSSELEEMSYLLNNVFDEHYVKWISFEDKKFSMISESFPSDFRKFIDFLTKYNKIIVMSGTLTSNGDFNSLINQWRVKKNEVITKKLDTPFDYQNQAIVYVPKKIVHPDSSNYLDNSVKEIQKLISLTGGRSLILTTSKEHMVSISEELSQFLKEKKINLYVQEQSGVEKLTKQFKEDETSVLVGSGSFFSGFSVPGKSLVSVILTKLPFPVPDDPFLELIGQGYEDELFDMVSFPYMINKLNQAAGRLIRDITDFGVFAILDPRIFTKKYGSKVQADLNSQGYKITRSFEEVAIFIDKKFKHGAGAQYQPYNRENIIVNDTLWEKPVIKKTAKIEKKIEKPSNEVTEIQIEFAKEICKQYNIKPARNKRTPDALYQYLIDSLYYNWEDTAIIENGFPFTNDKEKERLLKIKGRERKSVVMPKCLEFGCNGECREKTKLEIRESFKKDYNAEDVKFYEVPSQKCCRVCVEPLEIIGKYFNQTK